MLNSFFNRIISNLKNSNKIFFIHGDYVYLYKTVYLDLLKINYFLNDFKKKKLSYFQINQLVITQLF